MVFICVVVFLCLSIPHSLNINLVTKWDLEYRPGLNLFSVPYMNICCKNSSSIFSFYISFFD